MVVRAGVDLLQPLYGGGLFSRELLENLGLDGFDFRRQDSAAGFSQCGAKRPQLPQVPGAMPAHCQMQSDPELFEGAGSQVFIACNEPEDFRAAVHDQLLVSPLFSRHSRRRLRARKSSTPRLVALTPIFLQISAVSISSISRK